MKSFTSTLALVFIAFFGFNQDKISFDVIVDEPAFKGITIASFMGVNYSFGQTFSTNVGMELIVRKLTIHFRGPNISE